MLEAFPERCSFIELIRETVCDLVCKLIGGWGWRGENSNKESIRTSLGPFFWCCGMSMQPLLEAIFRRPASCRRADNRQAAGFVDVCASRRLHLDRQLSECREACWPRVGPPTCCSRTNESNTVAKPPPMDELSTQEQFKSSQSSSFLFMLFILFNLSVVGGCRSWLKMTLFS